MSNGILGGDVSAVFNPFFRGLGRVFSGIGSFLSNWFSAAENIGNAVDSLAQKIDILVLQINNEVQHLKDFKFDPKLKSRVINVPIAIEQIKTFVETVPKSLTDTFKKLTVDLKGLIAGLKQVAGQVSGEGGGGSGLIKTITWMSLLKQTFDRVEQFVDELKVIVDDIIEIRKQLEKLDAFFLQQGNPRKRVKGTTTQRVGKLHR